VLVFKQRYFLRFHNAVTVEERVFILESYLKTMLTPTVDKDSYKNVGF
jgi:hypothetical protein